MLVSAFDYALPQELIAQQPPSVRGGSRMLRLDRQTGACEDRQFVDLPALLEPGDLLVLNDSRVLPARLFATRAGLRTQAHSPAPGGVVEVLLTERLRSSEPSAETWRALVKPAKKVQPGETLHFAAAPGGEPLLQAEVIAAGEFGERTLRFAPAENFHAVLERIGHLPLPPYIHRGKEAPNTAEDRERYQTVYSVPFGQGTGYRVQGTGNREQEIGSRVQGPGPRGRAIASSSAAALSAPCALDPGPCPTLDPVPSLQGSAAAPTAGLHFTPEILAALTVRAVETARITLHVGLGTFQPVRVERTEDIRLHAEPYTLSSEAAEALNRAYAEGRRVVAVGTTTTRTLEHLARQFEAAYGALSPENPLQLQSHSGSTGLFLSPGPEGDHDFKLVGGLLTNFHLPQSTLLMLVSAFAGRERVLAAYAHAVAQRYRFFSYGDCMLLL